MHKGQTVQISVCSTDGELLSLCREAAKSPALGRCSVRLYSGAEQMPADGIRVFDLPSGQESAPMLDRLEREDDRARIVVIDRHAMSRFRSRLVMLQGTVVLKPLTRARLEITLEQAMGCSSPPIDEALIRSSRDLLLRNFLAANLRLQEYDQDRTNFLARAVHELRAPLTSLNGYCDLLLERKLGVLSSEQDLVIGRMRHSLSRLSGIVSSLLQLSAGECEAQQPRISVGNYVGCIEHAIHEVAPMFQDRRISLVVKLATAPGKIQFDSSQMEQVFINILDNSCKFTSRGGEVKIEGYPYHWKDACTRAPYDHAQETQAADLPAPNAYRLDISDDGPGIDPKHAPHIFEEFAAFGDGGDRSGTGLGLAICRMIVRRHRGGIWAESSGIGAKFSVVLPCES